MDSGGDGVSKKVLWGVFRGFKGCLVEFQRLFDGVF